MKRANLMVAIGAVLLLGGLVVVLVVGRDDGSAASEIKVPVLVARTGLTAGQAGDDLVASGKVGVSRVPKSEVQPGALTATTDIAGRIIGTSVADDDQLTSNDIRPENLRSQSVTIPKGKEAVAVTVDATSGGAGYAGPGDHVNLFVSIAPDRSAAKGGKPFTKLLLTDVEVLDVSDEVAPRRATVDTGSSGDASAAAGRTTSSSLTLLLALDAQQAEQAIFANTFDDVRITVLPKGAGKSTTGGVSDDKNYVVGQ